MPDPVVPEVVESERLRMDRIGPEHEQALYLMHSDSRVGKTLGGVRSRAENARWLEEKTIHWAEHGFGLYAFFDRTDETFVGRGGLLSVEIEGAREVELNYSIAPDRWNQGYATEAAARLIQVGIDDMSLDRVIAFTLTSNAASRRVIEKVGMAYDRDFVHHDRPHALYVYKR